MLIKILYQLILACLALLWAPYALLQMALYGKYKQSLLNRFGINFPQVERGSGPLIWVHAVSVGETKAVASLMHLLHKQDPSATFILSSITETGYAEGKRMINFPCTHVFLPFDFDWVLHPILKKLRPDLVILSETDFWYRFLNLAKHYGAKIAVVNGKISERSTQRLQRFVLFSDLLFRSVDLFCVQSHDYADRFRSIGIPANKIIVTGNMKFDQSTPEMSSEEKAAFKEKLGLNQTDPIIVVGSTHDTEEKTILDALKVVWKTHPNAQMILVPRHPERFDAVARLLEVEQIPFTRYTDNPKKKSKVVLIDAMGILMSCYQVATLAIVGGSFRSDIGGHNILEPAQFGVPVIFGPYMHNQKEMTDLVLDKQAGFQVQDLLLAKLVDVLLQDSQERQRIGATAKILAKEIEGATSRTAEALKKNLQFFFAVK